MATNNLTGENIVLPIYNQDGTPFNGLVLKKSVYESVVMSLGDKITGDVYYPNNALVVTMGEYVEYNGVRYVLVNPPVIVREGMISDNGELKGMTKYSFTFYHPMYMLGNFPFCDVAVSADQQRYLSENKTFAWIGNLVDYVAKINKNLESTEWYCVISDNVQTVDRNKLSEVESFDKNTIAEALKRGYEIWEIPYIISTIESTDPLYAQGKRYLIQYGLPTTEILVENEQHELVPFVFHFGQGVGLKNNSRTPRNNKIVTRIAGYGSEDNIPYGYPQIPYEGGTCQYPLYYGIVGGQRVQLIKHPFTRTHLMPPIYRETVNKKVNPMAVGYDPTIEIKDYYDADNTYENPIKPEEPSYEIHEFEKIKPEFGDNSILGVVPVSNDVVEQKYSTMSSFLTKLRHYMQQTNIDIERHVLNVLYDKVQLHVDDEDGRTDAKQYYFHYKIEVSGDYEKVVYESSNINFEETILLAVTPPAPSWDDEMDDDGNYKQSYFKITIPQLSFDVYASAAVTQEMTVNMRSGACLGCSFPVMVDWDDYKRNFFDEDGNFAPNGTQRDLEKYPNSQSGQIELTLQKETNTFGTLMPNIYQKPAAGDKFVFLGISMPTSYITAAESRLETDMKQYMRDNNVHYFDYPLKFDEKFLVDNIGILNQMQNNVVVRFDYAGEIHALYIKQISVKYENKPLPTYDITLTDDIEIVLNPIGQVTDDVSKLRLALGGGGVGGSVSGDYIRKDIDDTAYGLIRLIKGMQVGERFVTGLLGEGGMFRKESDGTTYLECDKLYVRMRAYFDTVEIRKYIHSGGNRIASLAGIKCSRVEYIDANGNVTNDASEATKFRCFFRANNDGQEVTNDFVVGDLAFCKETNASEAQGVEQHGYWRAVVGRNAQGVLTNDGEGWIDLSATDCLSGSDVPIAQDDIIQLGNKTDTTRQGAIIEFVGGADAPSYQIYQGINDYSLNGKNYIGLGYNSSTGRAYLNVYGDAYLGDPNESTYIKYNAGTKNLEIKAKISAESTIDGETLAQFISENTWTEEQIDALITAETDPLVDAIDEIKRQVDGSISTWFYDNVPTLENEPASGWTTDDDKNEHLGDLYYDNLTGYAYRFKYDELNRQYSWGRITDTDVAKALADAAKAQDTADHKRRVFVVQPTPPYDAGDLWVNATYPTGNTETNEAQNKYYNDVLRCKTSKASGTTFAIADWSLASKYTDDKALNDFKANQYVTALTNGTISTNITNAQNAADAAQQAADDAQSAADDAQTSADNAQSTANSASTAAANAQAAAQAADARAAALEYVKTALKQDTVIEGGLVLSTLIALRDGSNNIWSGISGTYQSAETGTGYKGHGIAAWFGGAMVDKEVTTTATDYAKSLFRFDGSGYVAGGNLSWDKSGNVTIQGYSINATTLKVGGSAVATQAALDSYLPLSAGSSKKLTDTLYSQSIFPKTDNTYNLGGTSNYWKYLYVKRIYLSADVYLEYDSTNTAVKLNGSFYATGGITALGAGSGGSGGGIDMAAVWTALGNNTSEQINASHLSTALSAYNPTSNFKTINGNSIIGTGNITIESSGGTVTAVKVGSTSYSPTDGVVSLPAYPTNADTLDGYHAYVGNTPFGKIPVIVSDGFMDVGNSFEMHYDNSGSLDYSTRLYCTGDYHNSVALPSTTGTLALTSQIPTKVSQLTNDSDFITSSASITGNAGSATKLQTSRTIWGQPFDGSGNVAGDFLLGNGGFEKFYVRTTSGEAHLHSGFLYDPSDNEAFVFCTGYTETRICFYTHTPLDSYERKDYQTKTAALCIYNNSVGIGNNSPEYKLDVDGDVRATNFRGNLVGNADSATKLKTARTIWGQSFDGTANVSGAISSTGNITPSSTRTSNIGSASLMYNYVYTRYIDTSDRYYLRICANGTEFIDLNCDDTITQILTATSISGLLTASGGITIPSGKTLTIGDAVLSWDSTNQGIKITKGLYSETFISALGAGSSGSSGVDMNTVWTALANNTNEQINASHLSTALNDYATQSWVTQQIASVPSSSTAEKLKTARTIWGQSFDGTANVSGLLSNVTGIQNSGYYYIKGSNDEWVSAIDKAPDAGPIFGYGQGRKNIPVYYTGYGIKINGNGVWNDTTGINITTSNNVGIGTGSPEYKLDVNGDVRATSFIGNASSATKLQTSRTIWGQNFDGSGNVAGSFWLGNSANNRFYVRNQMGGGEAHLHSGFLYDPSDNEAFVFCTGYTETRICFYTHTALDQYVGSDYLTKIPALCIYRGRVSINKLLPDYGYNLDVDGAVRASSFVMLNGTSSQFLKADGSVDSNSYALSSSLSGYLPLSGGTMSNTNLVTNLNAQYLNGYGAYNGTNKGYVFVGGDNYCEMGKHIEFHYDTTSGLDYSTVLQCTGNHRNIVSLPSVGGTLALTSDNVASATKLQTARTIWGQSFDGSGNVSGNLELLQNNRLYVRKVSSQSNYHAGFLYDYGGNEAFVFTTGYANARMVFYTKLGLDTYASTDFQTRTPDLCLYNNNVGIGTHSPSYKLHVDGTFYASGNSSIGGTFGVSGATTLSSTLGVTGATTLSSTLGVTGNTTLSGTLSVSKATTLSSTLGVSGATTLSSTLGVSGATTMSGKLTMNKSNIELVNTSSNDGIWVEMKGVSYDWGIATGSGNVNRGIIDFGGAGWMLYFDASNTYCEYGNFICSGGVTALSDVRHKRIVSNTDITIEQIARMRSVKFLWNDDRNDDAIHVGSIAQDWQSILPEVVIRKDDKDGTLSLNYGVAALVSVITTARKVVDHERRIKELEKENERLRFEVEQLKIA